MRNLVSVQLIQYRIITLLTSKSAASKSEILEALKNQVELMDIDTEIAERTFFRYLNSIEEIFGVEIKYNRSIRKYEIVHSNPDILYQKLFETYDILCATHIKGNMPENIAFDKSAVQDRRYLSALFSALRGKHRVKFLFKPFWDVEPETIDCEPCGLKEFRHRWYLIAKNLKDDEIRRFALDRVFELEVLEEKYVSSEIFNIEAYYFDAFGIVTPTSEEPLVVEDIVFWCSKLQSKYIRTLPLHHSQTILGEDEYGVKFKIRTYPSYDLLIELRSLGEQIKILEPQGFVNMMKESIEKSLLLYS